MDFNERWEKIKEIGKGGQGKVFQVFDKKKFDLKNEMIPGLYAVINKLSGKSTEKEKERYFSKFREIIFDLNRLENPKNHFALKVLHEAHNARDPKLAIIRIKNEIEAMSSIKHPNLLEIVDRDPDDKWYVSQLYQKGTLRNNNLFVGDPASALYAFRPLVEGVAELHKNNIVHRDIKPENVFIGMDNSLILGDFGIVFFTDSTNTRISATIENVGSRDWMPAWAMGMRIEDIKPTFDVFSLGKLLWSMISGKPILRLWYFNKEEFSVELMFPNVPNMNLLRRIFEKTIVEEEKDCLKDATELLELVDETNSVIKKNADLIGETVIRPCRVCGNGNYELIINDNGKLRNFGIEPAGARTFKVFCCNYCGHVQLFYIEGDNVPPAWRIDKHIFGLNVL